MEFGMKKFNPLIVAPFLFIFLSFSSTADETNHIFLVNNLDRSIVITTHNTQCYLSLGDFDVSDNARHDWIGYNIPKNTTVRMNTKDDDGSNAFDVVFATGCRNDDKIITLKVYVDAFFDEKNYVVTAGSKFIGSIELKHHRKNKRGKNHHKWYSYARIFLNGGYKAKVTCSNDHNDNKTELDCSRPDWTKLGQLRRVVIDYEHTNFGH